MAEPIRRPNNSHSGDSYDGLDNGEQGINRAPEIPNSGMPALFGMRSLRQMGELTDSANQRLYCVGLEPRQ